MLESIDQSGRVLQTMFVPGLLLLGKSIFTVFKTLFMLSLQKIFLPEVKLTLHP